MKRTPEEQRTYESNKQRMYRRDEWRCRNCERRTMLTPHHIVFQSQGGTDDLDNILCLCMICHDEVHRRLLNIEVIKELVNDIVVKFTVGGEKKGSDETSVE